MRVCLDKFDGVNKIKSVSLTSVDVLSKVSVNTVGCSQTEDVDSLGHPHGDNVDPVCLVVTAEEIELTLHN